MHYIYFRFSCPEWQAGPWSACSEKCGDAFQYRSVTCRSEKEGEEGKLLPAEACGELTIDDKRSCNLGPCEGLMFSTSDWNLVYVLCLLVFVYIPSSSRLPLHAHKTPFNRSQPPN